MLRPPFCPNRDCPCHIDPDSPDSHRLASSPWFKLNGSYSTRVRGPVRRFKCLVCGQGFSEQTFTLDYYVKRIIDYRWVQRSVCNCSGVRATARQMGCSCDSVSNRISRLARQYISAHSRLIAQIELNEDLAADGFESFAVSQYFPNNIHLLVGSSSQVVYFCDYVTLRRSGRMRASQKRVRRALEALYLPPPASLTSSFEELLDYLSHHLNHSTNRPTTLHTDRKLEYSRAFTSRFSASHSRLIHQRTDSRAKRDQDNPLFPVNYIDREFRKDLAEHVRETVRFARNVNHSMERLWIYLENHNLCKRFRINDPVGIHRTHATEAGATTADVSRVTAQLTRRRRFLSFEHLQPSERRVWCREHTTPLKGIRKGVLRTIGRQAVRGEVDLESIRRKLGVEKLIQDARQYLPRYALA